MAKKRPAVSLKDLGISEEEEASCIDLARNSEFVDELLEKSRSMERDDPLTDDEIKMALRMKKMGIRKEAIFDEIERVYFNDMDDEFEEIKRGVLGGSRGRYDKTITLIKQSYDILEPEHPMTIRQLFYRLVSIPAVQNVLSDYKRVSRVMKNARNENQIPFEWIVDRTKVEIIPSVWDDPAQYSEVVAKSYRKNRWQDQPCHVEIWSEKDAINGSVEPVYSRYGVTSRAYRGFNSTTKKYEIARFFNSLGKPVVILYLGDHDPSGWAIQGDLKNALTQYGFLNFTISRLAIMPEDIRIFRLPPLRVKNEDSRAPKFKARYGEEAVELDALPPVELRARLEKSISALIDEELWERAERVEQAELSDIRKVAGEIKKIRSGS